MIVMKLSTMRTIRWVLVGLGLTAGVVLVAGGNTLVGVVIGTLALVRLVLVVGQARRRRTLPGRPGGSSDDAFSVLRSLAHGQFEVAARAIGVSPADVRVDFARGRSIAEIAAGRGVPAQTVINAVAADASVTLDRAVADGEMTPSAAAHVKARLPLWATRLVNRRRGDLAAPGHVAA
jgi:hypothetical protein